MTDAADPRPDRRIGVIMLNTRFPRPVGDIGNPATFDCPVLYRTVDSATVERVVTGAEPAAAVAADILAAARSLDAEGIDVLVTSCGFLGTLQRDLEAAASVPVVSSALVAIPFLRQTLGAEAPLGVLTFDADTLAPHHFGGAHDDRIVIEGIEGTELHRVIAGDLTELDPDAARDGVTAAFLRLASRTPAPRAIVLECTNLRPYVGPAQARTGLPVFDLVRAIGWVLDALPYGRGAS